MSGAPLTRRALLRLVLLTGGFAGICGTDQPATRVPADRLTLVIATGVPQGVYEAWGKAFARGDLARPRPARLQVRSTTGSPMNLGLLADRGVDVALAALDSCERAMMTVDATTPRDWLRAVARVYDDYVHLLVLDSSPLVQLSDLAGARVVVGAVGSGTALIARRVLQAAGVRPGLEREAGLVDALGMLTDGTVEAVFWSGGLPTAAVTAAWQRSPLRLLPLDQAGLLLRKEHPVTYRSTAIPVGAYGNEQPVPTFAVPNVLAVRTDLPDEAVHVLLDVLVSSAQEIASRVPAFTGFDDRSAVHTEPVPLHDEARDFFRDRKI